MKDTQDRSLTFGFIPLDFVDIVWPDAKELLVGAVKTANGKFTLDDVKRNLDTGYLILWLVTDGTKPVAAITTRIIEYPQCKAMALDWIGGRRMKEWLPMAQKTIEQFAKDCGCTHMEGYGRRAWIRWNERYGWKQDYIAYRMELTDG